MSSRRFDGWCDGALVSAALGGERDAFAELIVRHRPTALAVTGRLMRTQNLAADAVQEASLLAMIGLERLRSPERFGAWLCGIALNVARRWLREMREIAITPDTAVADGTAAGPEELVEAAAMAADVRRAVDGLAEGQRDAVLLFYLQGLTHREVAEELAISVGAVKARLHQARAALAPRLAPLIENEEATVITKREAREWVDMSVRAVHRDEDGDPTRRRHVIILAERGGARELPIWVGPFEATAVALSLESTETPRPMTYQFAANLVAATGSRVEQVRIMSLAEGVFYAIVVVSGPGGREVDARPSDALNLALVTGAPIRVDAPLLGANGAGGRTEWRNYPDATADIASEVRQQRERDLAEGATTSQPVITEPPEPKP